MKTGYTIRQATADDIPVVIKNHSKMFEEMFTLEGKEIDVQKFQAMENSYSDKLANEFGTKAFNAWVIEKENEIVASGAISICTWVPRPDDPTYFAAYIHSMYTEKPHRNQGLAIKIVEAIKNYCNEKGIVKIFLTASDAGRFVYKSAGFLSNDSLMYYNNNINHTKTQRHSKRVLGQI